MHVHVVILICIMTMTQLVAHPVATVFDDVYQMMFSEERQGPENARLVYRLDLHLQFHQRQRTLSGLQRLRHQYTVRRRLYPMMLQELHTCLFIHNLIHLESATTTAVTAKTATASTTAARSTEASVSTGTARTPHTLSSCLTAEKVQAINDV